MIKQINLQGNTKIQTQKFSKRRSSILIHKNEGIVQSFIQKQTKQVRKRNFLRFYHQTSLWRNYIEDEGSSPTKSSNHTLEQQSIIFVPMPLMNIIESQQPKETMQQPQ